MGAIPSPRSATREDWCQLADREWHELGLEYAELVLFQVLHNPGFKEMVLARIRAGESFGPLDLKSIDFPVMAAEEAADGIAYLAGQRLHERTSSR